MENEILFSEVQKKEFKLLNYFLYFMMGLSVVAIIAFSILLSDELIGMMIIDITCLILFAVMFFILKYNKTAELETIIDSESIKIMLKPLFRKQKIVKWNEIEDVEAGNMFFNRRKATIPQNPGGIFKNSRQIFNISGSNGLYIYLKKGGYIFLGSNKIKELQELIDSIRNKQH